MTSETGMKILVADDRDVGRLSVVWEHILSSRSVADLGSLKDRSLANGVRVLCFKQLIFPPSRKMLPLTSTGSSGCGPNAFLQFFSSYVESQIVEGEVSKSPCRVVIVLGREGELFMQLYGLLCCCFVCYFCVI